MIDTWNPAKLNEKISGRDSWNPAILNEAVTDRDSWNPAILNESDGETPVVFEATITASFPEGATCTATDGTTTLTADDNPMAFSIPNSGTWTVACIANGVTLSEDVVITTDGQTETVDLTPVGATVTPTDSVPMLIACVGIGDSEITTIAGLLTDSTTLAAVISSNNAIDYLVRSTTFASSITADSTAMTDIGANNYASDTLRNNSTWVTAIGDSTYIDSVLNTKVPILSNNTNVLSSAVDSGLQKYYAFNGNLTTDGQRWSTAPGSGYIGYKFSSPVSIHTIEVKNRVSGINIRAFENFKLQGSNDGDNWTDIAEFLNEVTEASATWRLSTVNSNAYSYNRALITSAYDSTSWTNAQEVQFYGRQDVNV